MHVDAKQEQDNISVGDHFEYPPELETPKNAVLSVFKVPLRFCAPHKHLPPGHILCLLDNNLTAGTSPLQSFPRNTLGHRLFEPSTEQGRKTITTGPL